MFITIVLLDLDHIPLTVWSEIMTKVLQIDLPWLILRSKIVEEDAQGVLYNSMFDGFTLDNTKLQMVLKRRYHI